MCITLQASGDANARAASASSRAATGIWLQHLESLHLVGPGTGLAEIMHGWATDPVLSGALILLEPGRFLVGPSGAYLARVVDRKDVDGSTVVILDGGVHHVLRPALVGQEHRIRAFGGRGESAGGFGRMIPVTVAGPLCSGLDVFSQSAIMTPPEVGDLVAVLDVGSWHDGSNARCRGL